MKRTILATVVTLTCGLAVIAQEAQTQTGATASSQASASASKAGRTISINSGTKLAADLQQTIDARKAKVGDQVVFKTTRALKSEGQTVVRKGARLIGHVSEVESQKGADAISRIGLVFDRLENGSLAVPITASIISITSASTSASSSNQDLFATEDSTSGRARSSSTGSQGGGVLGSTSSTVGGVVNTTTSSLGNVVNNTTAASGSVVNSATSSGHGSTSGISQPLGRIQISESSNTSAEAGSTLSLRGENLRLEKGTTFNLVIVQSASARKEP